MANPAITTEGQYSPEANNDVRPSTTRFNELRIFAFVVPVVLYLLYFLALGLTEGIVWSIHLWLGSCILAGVVGFLLSYLMVGPRSSGERGDV